MKSITLQPARNGRRFGSSLGLGAILLVAALAGGCKRPAPNAAPPPPPAVTVALPIQREVIEWDEYTGYLDAVDSVEVRARVSGLIMSTPFHEGTTVNQGDVLVEIDVRPFQAELEARQADEARAAAQVDLAQIELDRVQGISLEARAYTEVDRASATLRETQAVRAGAKAAVESARLNVEWCRVTAPIAGRISRKLVTPGNLITGGGTQQATLLTTITSIDPVYCHVDADEQSVLRYQRLAAEGKRISARDTPIPCFLQLSDETGFPHEGMVDFVDNRLDPMTGTIRARGTFRNPDRRLVPGYFARVRVPGSGRYRALLVPDAAVGRDQDRKLLLVVGPDNVVQARQVKLGALFGELRSIESGVEPDDRIVINGLMNARPGAKVSPQETTIPTESIQLTAPGSPATQALPAGPGK